MGPENFLVRGTGGNNNKFAGGRHIIYTGGHYDESWTIGGTRDGQSDCSGATMEALPLVGFHIYSKHSLHVDSVPLIDADMT